MEKVFENFFTPSVLFFCLFVWGLVMIQRRIVEKFVTSLKTKKLWNDLFLPIGPVITGCIVALLAKKYPYPDPFNASLSARLFFGFVCGGASGYVYRIIKAFLTKKEADLEKEMQKDKSEPTV